MQWVLGLKVLRHLFFANVFLNLITHGYGLFRRPLSSYYHLVNDYVLEINLTNVKKFEVGFKLLFLIFLDHFKSSFLWKCTCTMYVRCLLFFLR